MKKTWRNFNDHCREKTFKDATHRLVQIISCVQTVHWWHNCGSVGTAEVLVLFKAAHESYTPTAVGCVLETVFSIKEQLKPDRLSSGFDTKRTPAPQTLSRAYQIYSQTDASKGQDLLMMMMAGMMMKTTKTVLPFLSASLFTSLLFLLLRFPEWPEGNQTTNKRVNKETAYIDPWAL